jgi:hypothetical protein
VISGWPTATEHLNLDRGTGGLFYHPHSLAPLMPEPPMGMVIGFHYREEDNGAGHIRYLSDHGIGRYLLYHLHDLFRWSQQKAGPHVLLTSGTSWAPSSWRYHLHRQPDYVLAPSELNQQGRIEFFFEPLVDPAQPSRLLTVSGSGTGEQRLRALRAMIRRLAATDASGASSLLDEELSKLDPARRRILLVCGSYEEAADLADLLESLRGVEDSVTALVRDGKKDDEPGWVSRRGRLTRSRIKDFAQTQAQFLIAPLQAVERGHNILAPGSHKAALGAVYFLARPMPVPGDPASPVQKLNYWAMETVPNIGEPRVATAARWLRREARLRWENALEEPGFYERCDPDRRTPVLWTELVIVAQTIGRLLRGGAGARVHFVDAKWAEKTPQGETDSEATSMLLGFERILRQAIEENPDVGERAIADALYGMIYRAITAMPLLRAEQASAQQAAALSPDAVVALADGAGSEYDDYGGFDYDEAGGDGEYGYGEYDN